MMKTKEKKVLVTGASGYIGSHTVEYLRSIGYTVLSATRDYKSNLYMDFSKPYNISEMSCSGIDAVVHTVSPKETLIKNKPYSAMQEGILGIKSILDFCVKNNIPRFIYVSSFHALGTVSGILDETALPAPQNDYGMIHYLAEQMVGYYTRTGKLKGSCIRPSNVYGMPVSESTAGRWDLTPFSFCRDAVMNSKIILKTSGIQKRNFVDVTNVSKCIGDMIEHPEIPILHSFGPETLSVREFAQIVCSAAEEVFERKVELIMPPANGIGEKLNFCSRFSCIDQSKQTDIYEYCKQMCQYLKNVNIN